MPTARPIITASTGVIELTSVNAVMNTTISEPMAMPTTAVISGRPAATSEPKVITRTAAAMVMPMISDVALTATGSIMPGPIASTFMPASRPICMASNSAWRFSGVMSLGTRTSKANCAMPWRPSSDSIRMAWASASATACGRPERVPVSTTVFCSSGFSRTGLTSISSAVSWVMLSLIDATTASAAAKFSGSSSFSPSGASNTTYTVCSRMGFG